MLTTPPFTTRARLPIPNLCSLSVVISPTTYARLGVHLKSILGSLALGMIFKFELVPEVRLELT